MPFLLTPPRKLARGEFVVMLAMVMALGALGIDAMLPALPDIARDLRVQDPNDRQLIVGSYLIGMGFGAIVFGFLADRFGRKRVLISGIACYCLFDFGCMIMSNFELMVAFRFVNGFVASSGIVIASAIVRDEFEGDQMARITSLIAVVFMIVPVMAPTLGQAVLLFAGWRAIFGLTFGMGIIMLIWVTLRMPETLAHHHRQAITVKQVAHNFRLVVTNRDAVGYVLGASLVFGGLYGYLNSSEQLVAEHFGQGGRFAYIFGGMAMFMALGSLINSRIVERFGARRVSHSALLVFVTAGAAQWIVATVAPDNFWLFLPIMTLNLSLIGFLGANFTSIALQPFAHFAGSASSLQTTVRTGGGAVIGAVVGAAYDGTARPVAMAMFGLSLTAILLVLYSERGKLFRRRKGFVPQVTD